MCCKDLLEAHREVNRLLTKLALGMGKSELNQRVVTMAESWFGQRVASILKLDDDKQRLYLEFAPNLPNFYNQAIEGVEIGPQVGSCGAAAYLKQSITVSDINTHPNWAPFTELTQKANLHACWSVPILSSQNSVMGTFAIYSKEPSVPSDHEVEVLEMLASLYSVAWEKYQLEDQLNFYANSDPLTGCLNRRALIEEAETVLQNQCFEGKVLGCMFVDVDKFKQINDSFGHKFGDEVLVSVAETLTENTNVCAKIGRYGGDEFVVFSCYSSVENALERYEELQVRLAQALQFNGIKISVSVGLACRSTDIKLEHLIALADKNMYQIKQAKAATE